MDYSAIYFRIIERARARGIGDERHHILPVSLGGTNRRSNLVDLTLKEHFLCHLLLTKMTEGEARQKMSAAFVLMAGRYRGQLPSSRLYENARGGMAERTRQQWRDPVHRANVTEKMRQNARARVEQGWQPPWTGKKRTPEQSRAQSERQRGKPGSEKMKASLRKPCEVFGVMYETFGQAVELVKRDRKITTKGIRNDPSFRWVTLQCQSSEYPQAKLF